MYLVQGLSIIAFTEIPLIYENGLLFTLCVMTTTIVMAYMFNLFNRKKTIVLQYINLHDTTHTLCVCRHCARG